MDITRESCDRVCERIPTNDDLNQRKYTEVTLLAYDSVRSPQRWASERGFPPEGANLSKSLRTFWVRSPGSVCPHEVTPFTAGGLFPLSPLSRRCKVQREQLHCPSVVGEKPREELKQPKHGSDRINRCSDPKPPPPTPTPKTTCQLAEGAESHLRGLLFWSSPALSPAPDGRTKSPGHIMVDHVKESEHTPRRTASSF